MEGIKREIKFYPPEYNTNTKWCFYFQCKLCIVIYLWGSFSFLFFFLPHLLPPPLLLTQQEIWKLCLSVCVRMNMRAYLTVRFCVEIFKRLSSALRRMQTSAGAASLAAAVHEGQSSRADKTFSPALSRWALALLAVNHLLPSFPSCAMVDIGTLRLQKESSVTRGDRSDCGQEGCRNAFVTIFLLYIYTYIYKLSALTCSSIFCLLLFFILIAKQIWGLVYRGTCSAAELSPLPFAVLVIRWCCWEQKRAHLCSRLVPCRDRYCHCLLCFVCESCERSTSNWTESHSRKKTEHFWLRFKLKAI